MSYPLPCRRPAFSLFCILAVLLAPVSLHAASGSPKVTYYPVRGAHQHGTVVGGAYTCANNYGYSESDFVAGSHLGNDIMANKGTPVVATTTGIVQGNGDTGTNCDGAKKVTIRDSNGWYYFYTHLDSISSGISPGVTVTAGQQIGTLGNTGYTGTGSCINTNPGRADHLHYSIYPDGNYDAGVDPYPYLAPVEVDVCTMPGTTPPPPSPTKYYVDTFASANGYASPTHAGVAAIGQLYSGRKYVYCRTWGDNVSSGSSYNHWWLWTDLDTHTSGAGQGYVSAFYLSHWGNDEAKDNNGVVIPDCVSSTPPPPVMPTTKYSIDTFAAANGYASPTHAGVAAIGQLNSGRNYAFCKKWGDNVSSGGSYNHWWLWTDLSTHNSGSGQGYVSAFYLSHWGNDVAKDNNGVVIPDCP